MEGQSHTEPRQNPTNGDARKELTPQQAAAADLLASGQTLTDVAASIGVSRQTVSLWLNQNSTFAAEVGRRRADVWEAASARLRALLPAALDVIERQLQANSVSTAVAVLKAAGLHGLGPPRDPQSAEEVSLHRRERAADLRLRAMGADFL